MEYLSTAKTIQPCGLKWKINILKWVCCNGSVALIIKSAIVTLCQAIKSSNLKQRSLFSYAVFSYTQPCWLMICPEKSDTWVKQLIICEFFNKRFSFMVWIQSWVSTPFWGSSSKIKLSQPQNPKLNTRCWDYKLYLYCHYWFLWIYTSLLLWESPQEKSHKHFLLFLDFCPPLPLSLFLHSHRGQPPCDQCDPRERPAHLLRLHPGWHSLGCRQSADLHTDADCVLLLPAAPNHPGCGLLHAEQALLQQHGGHPGLCRHRDMLERRQRGALVMGVSPRRSHGYETFTPKWHFESDSVGFSVVHFCFKLDVCSGV